MVHPTDVYDPRIRAAPLEAELSPSDPFHPSAMSDPTFTRSFRDAMGAFPTGVAIVTALRPDGTPCGLTVNSLTSVSLDPVLLLVCLGRSSESQRSTTCAPPTERAWSQTSMGRLCRNVSSSLCFAPRPTRISRPPELTKRR